MFEQLMNKLAEMLAVRMESNRKADAWSMTVECWHCHQNVPQSHMLCGYCGATLHSPRRQLTPQQEQVAELETQQVNIVKDKHILVNPAKNPLLYSYLKFGVIPTTPTMNTGQTEPLRLSPHQTRQLVKKYAE